MIEYTLLNLLISEFYVYCGPYNSTGGKSSDNMIRKRTVLLFDPKNSSKPRYEKVQIQLDLRMSATPISAVLQFFFKYDFL